MSVLGRWPVSIVARPTFLPFSGVYTSWAAGYLFVSFHMHARGCVLFSLNFIIIYFLPHACKVLWLSSLIIY